MIKHKKIPILIRDVFSPDDGPARRINFDFEFFQKEQLDIMFSVSYSDKAVAPFVASFVKNIGEEWKPIWELDENSKLKISELILAYYKIKWEKLISLLKIEYDPIHNFEDKIHEDISDIDSKNIKSDMLSKQTGSGDKIRTDDLTSTDNKNLITKVTGTNEDQIQGFNSTSYQNKDKSLDDHTTTETGTDTINNTGTQKTQETRDFTNTNSGSEDISGTYKRTKDSLRTGNIGNITTQAMITQEIELWRWNFMNEVLNDIQSLLTLQVYPS